MATCLIKCSMGITQSRLCPLNCHQHFNKDKMIQTITSAGIAQNPLLCPVIFQQRKYYGIKEFDGKVVSLFTEPTLQGTFLTVIPISPFEYRKKSPTKTKMTHKSKINELLPEPQKL